jgi:hypothetical protein
MVQVDVFWAYGMGSGLALAAAARLRRRPESPDGPSPGSRHLTGAVLYLALLFAPAGVWLLREFPSWQTMHVADGPEIPGWFAAIIAAATVAIGTAGFVVTQYLLQRNRDRIAYALFGGVNAVALFLLGYGWDGTGYRRFLSITADFHHWSNASIPDHAAHWAESELGRTVIGLSAVMVAVFVAMCLRWQHLAGRSETLRHDKEDGARRR